METLTIITTVGTSMFENYKQTFLNGKKNISNSFEQLKKLKVSDLDYTNPYVINLIGNEEDYGIQEKFFKGNVIKQNNDWTEIKDSSILNTNASAEISSIIKITEKHEEKNIKVNLLASDTVLSMLSAKLIQEWFQEARIAGKYKNIEIIFNDNVKSGSADFIKNLRPNLSEDEIFAGFNNLVKKVVELAKNDETIINITGGYKGFIPILTIVAQIEGLKLNYLYEDSDKLIEITEFPISFDVFIAETYHYYLEENNNLKHLESEEKEKLIKLSLITKDDKITEIGQFFLEYLKNVDFSRDTLGHYYEHKLFYQLFEKKVEGFELYSVEKLGHSYMLTDGRNGEIDLILNSSGGKCFIEVKSYNKAAKSTTKEQIEKYVNYSLENSITLKKIVLFVYKFDFQNLKQKLNQFKEMKTICENNKIEFSVLFSDIQMSKQEMVNYKNLFESEMLIKKYL